MKITFRIAPIIYQQLISYKNNHKNHNNNNHFKSYEYIV